MPAGGISRLRSLRSSFSQTAPLSSRLPGSKASRFSPANGVGPLWQPMQYCCNVARWVAADAEEGLSAASAAAGQSSAPANTMPIEVRARVRSIRPSHTQTCRMNQIRLRRWISPRKASARAVEKNADYEEFTPVAEDTQ